MTDRHLPAQFQAGALRAVFTARRLAYDACSAEFSAAEADNLRPFYARGKLEILLRDVAAMVPSCRAEVIRGTHFWNRTEIYSGPITLTAHSVQMSCELVEDAENFIQNPM